MIDYMTVTLLDNCDPVRLACRSVGQKIYVVLALLDVSFFSGLARRHMRSLLRLVAFPHRSQKKKPSIMGDDGDWSSYPKVRFNVSRFNKDRCIKDQTDVQHSTAQHSTAVTGQYNTAQHNTAQLLRHWPSLFLWEAKTSYIE